MPVKRPSGRRCFGWFIAVALIYLLFCLLGVQIDKTNSDVDLIESAQWVKTGKSWLDRQACRWIGLCGTMHLLKQSAWTSSNIRDALPPPHDDPSQWWTSGDENPDSWSKEERLRREIPQYVLDHAPYVHLFSGEQFWPCDIGEHLTHTTTYLNYTKVEGVLEERNLTNLNELNDYESGEHSRYMYLQSNDNPEERPEWLVGAKNIPRLPVPLDDEPPRDDAPPDLDDLKDYDLESLKQQALDDAYKSSATSPSAEELPTGLSSSPDGRCGGSSGFTCKGSRAGRCCSIYGWCGNSEEYCGDPCDPLAGDCYDPYNPPRGPHVDLRKRSSTLDLNGDKHKPQPGGKSSAPAILIVVPKENGIVDAFWFFFYSFNLGQTVLNIRFGNHVGDWEHTCVRFRNGKPIEVFLSEHNFGQAFTWKAMEKYIPSHDGSGTMIGSWSNETAGRMAKRPVVYSAIGSHAMYGTPGLHPYIIPFGLLHDETDRGPLWDPAKNFQAYTYDPKNRTMRASTLNPTSPVSWLHYAGHWGDKYYELSDPRQYRFAGQYHYVNGPTGPKFKNLGRSRVCQRRGKCDVRHWLGGSKLALGNPEEDVEDGTLPGGNQTDDTSASVALPSSARQDDSSYSEVMYDEGKEEFSMWTR
ncbi:putative vacuolar protein sorting-associated protein TDA6 [Cercospora beticola]|uniref:Putative vacuolar protein sorting-associated protein TDA6 n=1 Tax=Cercospora beticola TaxID=122368 RepID=A0A2G5HU09_CERBT|nr:putative vacuolar protein sorting-associated protein TDA6 [Cercospora beticola]PIA95702.1 putative vacuolar protein sorting-associated protein TDA6 [Cercospora beticola]WPB07143.1 hypothetical protein RHO25_011803 [Cercospora beticola]CAK1367099.1 unnamed protein product [Cercospora beticola]